MDSIQEVEPSSNVNEVNDKSFNIHSELKKLTHLERVQLYNKIRIEEEQEQEKERNELEKKEQEKQTSNCNGNSNGNCNMTNCRQMNAQYQSVFSELRGLRIQIQQLQNEMQYLNNNNIHNIQNKSQLQRNNIEEYENDDTCSIFSLICDWMPIWIFVSFILFTLTSKPKLCSISGSGVGSCPIAGLGEMFTKL